MLGITFFCLIMAAVSVKTFLDLCQKEKKDKFYRKKSSFEVVFFLESKEIAFVLIPLWLVFAIWI